MIYDIVSASRTDKLEMAVQKKIDAGWLPQGGITYAAGMYHQAMIKAGISDGLTAASATALPMTTNGN